MAHTAQLNVENRTYKIVNCEYEFTQVVDQIGQPCTHPDGGLIHLMIESPDNSDLFMHNWMLNSTERKDGNITFKVVNAGKPSTKTLHFKDTHCVGLEECFDTRSDAQMTTKIILSAKEISFGTLGNTVFKHFRG